MSSTNDKQMSFADTRTRVLVESMIALAASAFFWGWAVLLTITVEWDTGVICFVPTFISGLGGFMLARGRMVPQRLLTIGTGLAFAFTTAVFIVASINNDQGQLHLAYLSVSACLWSVFSIIFIVDINKLYQEGDIDVDRSKLLATARISNAL